MLRLSSEALPMVAAVSDERIETQSAVSVCGGELVLRLARRKNKAAGSRLVRGCWCKECPRTCPVHVVGKLVSSAVHGAALFGGITPAGALEALRHMLAAIGVEHAAKYRKHDVRRGHALDLCALVHRCGRYWKPASGLHRRS